MRTGSLVSVAVIAYNSSEFILETLQSIYDQTYGNLELIISDDCSADGTVELCEKWLECHRERFVNSRILKESHNKGIPANCNRAFKACNGEWIKLIAGDDILLSNCLSANISFILAHTGCQIVHSDALFFKKKLGDTNNVSDWRPSSLLTNSLTPQTQYKSLLYKNFIIAGTTFMSKNLFELVGGFDESFNGEDYPMWIKITHLGHYIYYMNISTIGYRLNSNSVMHSYLESKAYFNYHGYRTKFMMMKKYVFHSLSSSERLLYSMEFILLTMLNKLGLNRSNYISGKLFSIIHTLPEKYRKYKLKKISGSI